MFGQDMDRIFKVKTPMLYVLFEYAILLRFKGRLSVDNIVLAIYRENVLKNLSNFLNESLCYIDVSNEINAKALGFITIFYE